MTTEEVMRSYYHRFESAQIFEELWWLWQKVKEINPKIITEIGLYKGGTLRCFISLITDPHGLAIGIDQSWIEWKEKTWDITDMICPVKLIDGDSHKENTAKELSKILGGRKIDFLFIDGDHSEKGVTLDYQMYKGFVRDGGIIGFHDINMDGDEGQIKTGNHQVKGFWENFDHKKYSLCTETDSYGIGYIIKGEDEEPS